MTTKYNKSEILKNAWSFFFAEMGSFPLCLKEAWAQAKNTVKKVAVNTVKDVYDFLAMSTNFKTGLRNEVADEIITKVAQFGNGVAKKIAEQFRYNEKELSTKQAWAVAYNFLTIK
jgi:hypothetical protein